MRPVASPFRGVTSGGVSIGGVTIGSSALRCTKQWRRWRQLGTLFVGLAIGAAGGRRRGLSGVGSACSMVSGVGSEGGCAAGGGALGEGEGGAHMRAMAPGDT